MAFSWCSCIPPCVILLYANHRLRNIMSGPNLAETKQISQKEYTYPIKYGCIHGHWYTVDGTVPIPKDYIDEENLVVEKNVTYEGIIILTRKKRLGKSKRKHG